MHHAETMRWNVALISDYRLQRRNYDRAMSSPVRSTQFPRPILKRKPQSTNKQIKTTSRRFAGARAGAAFVARNAARGSGTRPNLQIELELSVQGAHFDRKRFGRLPPEGRHVADTLDRCCRTAALSHRRSRSVVTQLTKITHSFLPWQHSRWHFVNVRFLLTYQLLHNNIFTQSLSAIKRTID